MLPIVKPDIRHSIQHEMRDPAYLSSVYQRIMQQNPVVASFIDWVVTRYDDPLMTKELTNACVTVYRLLESQAEADDLSTGN